MLHDRAQDLDALSDRKKTTAREAQKVLCSPVTAPALRLLPLSSHLSLSLSLPLSLYQLSAQYLSLPHLGCSRCKLLMSSRAAVRDAGHSDARPPSAAAAASLRPSPHQKKQARGKQQSDDDNRSEIGRGGETGVDETGREWGRLS